MSFLNTSSGLPSYDSANWREHLPRQTHVMPMRDGLGFLRQTTEDLSGRSPEQAFEVSVPALHGTLVLLYFRRPARALHMQLGHPWKTLSLAPRDAIAVPQGMPSQWSGVASDNDGIVHIHLDAKELSARAEEAKVGMPAGGQVRHHLRCPRLDHLVEFTLSEIGPAGDASALTWSSIACLMQLATLNLLGNALAQRSRALARWQERRCLEYLNDHLAREVSLRELADVVGLSPFHFARQFKRSLGIPPHAYQVRLRYERACDLLLDPHLSVLDVASAVGYGSAQAFARSFRREAGVSPSQWRRAHLRKGANS